MNNEAMKEVLNELFSHLEKLETQSEAILQFLKEKKRVTDKQLAPYLEQAGNASNVKWRAARVRIDHLLSPEQQEKETKLGKKPELHEDSSSKGSSEDSRSERENQAGKDSEPENQNGKRTEIGDLLSGDSDQRNKGKSETENAKAHPVDAQTEKPDVRSESASANKEVAAQTKGSEKSDAQDARHPPEAAQPLAEQQNAEPAAQLKPDKPDQGKEAA